MYDLFVLRSGFDARKLAVMRIAFAVALLCRLGHLPEVDLALDGPLKLALVGAGYLVAVALLVGHRARTAAVLAFAVVRVLGGPSPVLLDGGERALRVLGFWLMFADVGAAFSLDTVLGRRPPRGRVAATGARLLQLQVVLLLVESALAGSVGEALWVALVGGILFVPSSLLDRLRVVVAARVPEVVVIFDGRCGFCRASLERVLALDPLQRIVPRDAHDPATRAAWPALDPERTQRELVAVGAHGRLTGGFDAFRTFAWRLPALWPLLPLLYLPPVPTVGRAVYRGIARRRLRLGGVCTLGPGVPVERPRVLPDPPAPGPRLVAVALAAQLAAVAVGQLAAHDLVPAPLLLTRELRLVGLEQP